MTVLLDVNVLIALIDTRHSMSQRAHRWFEDEGHRDFATCPITENGVVRIVGSAKYPTTPGSPAAVMASMRSIRDLNGHHFWPDDISLLDHRLVDPAKILNAAQVTDTYLLALAVFRGGRLATFDRRLVVTAAVDGRSALNLIE